jgi:hypothetical protein
LLGVKRCIGDTQLAADIRYGRTQLNCFRANKNQSWVNRDFFIGTTSAEGTMYHVEIMFLNVAGFWLMVSLTVKINPITLFYDFIKNYLYIEIKHEISYC